MNTGQWIDLYKMRVSFMIAAYVDSPRVSAAQDAPGIKGDGFGIPDNGIFNRIHQPILDQFLTVFFVLIVCLPPFSRFKDELKLLIKFNNKHGNIRTIITIAIFSIYYAN
jgi:hypothetical protein